MPIVTFPWIFSPETLCFAVNYPQNQIRTCTFDPTCLSGHLCCDCTEKVKHPISILDCVNLFDFLLILWPEQYLLPGVLY